MKANALRPGDLVSLIAPASGPVSSERVEKSVMYFEKLGYQVKVGKHVMDRRGYLAAPDKSRLQDLHKAFADRRVRAIFFIRGGYGSIRLLPEIDYDLIARNPKILVGYSDATALFLALHRKSKLRSMFLGPMPGVDIWNGFDPFSEEHFWRALTSIRPLGELPLARSEGRMVGATRKFDPVTARLLGGNLTVFSSMCGTPYMPSTTRHVLIFEDIDERPYRIDRYLAQLRAMGAIGKAKAILLGQFNGCDAEEGAPSLTISEIFKDYFGNLPIPIISNLPFGHVARQWTLPFGARYSIHADGRRARILVPESTLK